MKEQVIENNLALIADVLGNDITCNSDCADGMSYFDALRVLTYVYPKCVNLGDFIVLEWIYKEDERESIIQALDTARSENNLKAIQTNYCFIEPDISLYGKEPFEASKANEVIDALLDTISIYWKSYFDGIAENYKVQVNVDYENGRVEFYQVFDM